MKKICIIEDDADLRDIYSKTFQQEGFEVVTAKDGEEGLQKIREYQPDAITLDLQMPIKDGFAVLKALRSDVRFSQIPVIVLSNVDDEQAFRAAEESKSCFYLIKVMTSPQKMVDLVCEALQSRKSSPEA